MNNFVQFNDISEVFAKYLKDEKGVDVTVNFGILKDFLIFDGAMITIFGELWLYDYYKNKRNDNIENRYQCWKRVQNCVWLWGR